MSGTALLTGGARRIGAALARELVGLGFDLALHYNRSGEDAEALARELRAGGSRVELFQADFSDRRSLEALVPQVKARFGRIDLLVNNASIFIYDDLPTLGREAWDLHLAVNFTAPIFLIRDFASAMDAAGRGLVVNMLDQKVVNSNPDYFSYTGGKTGLAGMTRALALALAPRIRVCAIAPGMTLPSGKQSEADFERAAKATPMGYTTSLEDIRRALRFIVEAPAFNGQTLTLDAGESLLARTRDVAYDDGLR